MPEYQTDHAEMYLCTSVLLPDEPLKLVGVEPLSKEEVVHHMLLFGEGQDPTYAPYIVSAFHKPALRSAQCLLVTPRDAEVSSDTQRRASCRLCATSSSGQGVGLPHAQRLCRGGQPCLIRMGQGRRGDAPPGWGGI